MLRTVLVHLRAQWAGFLALFLVLAGGTAHAADTVFDLAANSVAASELANNTVTGAKLANSSLSTADVPGPTRWARSASRPAPS